MDWTGSPVSDQCSRFLWRVCGPYDLDDRGRLREWTPNYAEALGLRPPDSRTCFCCVCTRSRRSDRNSSRAWWLSRSGRSSTGGSTPRELSPGATGSRTMASPCPPQWTRTVCRCGRGRQTAPSCACWAPCCSRTRPGGCPVHGCWMPTALRVRLPPWKARRSCSGTGDYPRRDRWSPSWWRSSLRRIFPR